MSGSKPRLLWLLLLVVTAGLATVAFAQPVDDTVHVYFGNPDGSPIIANPARPLIVDCWIQTPQYVYLGGIVITLGTQDNYFAASLNNWNYAQKLYPLTEWFEANFASTWMGAPPSNSGWHSQLFLAARSMGGIGQPIHFDTPTKILRFVYLVQDSSSIIGDTVLCFNMGPSPESTYWQSTDTLGLTLYPLKAHFSRVSYQPPSDTCDYITGDINGDGLIGGADVVYLVRYLKAIGLPPVDSCYSELIHTSNHYFYVAADVNGNCEFRGSDITKFVSYFKIGGLLGHCILFPPGR